MEFRTVLDDVLDVRSPEMLSRPLRGSRNILDVANGPTFFSIPQCYSGLIPSWLGELKNLQNLSLENNWLIGEYLWQI